MDRTRFDKSGTLLLALTLGLYALAMTFGRGNFGLGNVVLLFASVAGGAFFVFAEKRTASPLISLAMFRDRALSTSLITNLLVSAVVMSTLVVGPFYLARSLALNASMVGIAMSVGPIVAAMAGLPAGRLTDRVGAGPMTITGLFGMAVGSSALSLIPTTVGIPGYIAPIAIMTAGYAVFQTANNTALMKGIRPDERGVVSGLLNLSRNLGLITGASVMGAAFAFATGTTDIKTAAPEAVSTGMRVTFAIAAILILIAIRIVMGGRRKTVLGLGCSNVRNAGLASRPTGSGGLRF